MADKTTVKQAKDTAAHVIERKITVNNAKIHVKSIFNSKTSLDNAMKNIVAHRLAQIRVK